MSAFIYAQKVSGPCTCQAVVMLVKALASLLTKLPLPWASQLVKLPLLLRQRMSSRPSPLKSPLPTIDLPAGGDRRPKVRRVAGEATVGLTQRRGHGAGIVPPQDVGAPVGYLSRNLRESARNHFLICRCALDSVARCLPHVSDPDVSGE